MKFVDATGFPVLPSINGASPPEPYWYREDFRVSRGREDFWDSARWLAVTALFNHPNYPRREKRDWNGRVVDTAREIAFEVGKDPHPEWPAGHYWPLDGVP